MDTAQKFLKTSAILIAATLLLATVGFAQIPTLVAPSTVTIGGTGFNTASVTSSVAGTEINYTIAITYPNGNPSGRNWLVVDPSGTTTTPTPSMRFGLSGNSAAGLTNGVSAKVTLTPTGPAGVSTTPVPITVTFDASGGGTWPRINHGHRSKISQDFRYFNRRYIAPGDRWVRTDPHTSRSFHRHDWRYRLQHRQRD